jgi:hypothetical protein
LCHVDKEATADFYVMVMSLTQLLIQQLLVTELVAVTKSVAAASVMAAVSNGGASSRAQQCSAAVASHHWALTCAIRPGAHVPALFEVPAAGAAAAAAAVDDLVSQDVHDVVMMFMSGHVMYPCHTSCVVSLHTCHGHERGLGHIHVHVHDSTTEPG